MSRAPRLLALLRSLQGRRARATAEALAEELGVSTPTLSRDIATLKAEGAPVAGAAGLGCILRRSLSILQPPTDLDVGRALAALDPDGHRLRVVAPSPG